MKNDQWFGVFTALTGQKFDGEEARLWTVELKNTITAWRDEQSIEKINDELCNIIRWAMSQEQIPRADTGRKSARYCLADLIKWTKLWKRNKKDYDSSAGVSTQDQYIMRAMKRVFTEWAKDKRWADIAFGVTMPHNDKQLAAEIKYNFSLSDSGVREMEIWLDQRYGMDVKRVVGEWTKENYKRVMDNRKDFRA